ncbi:MAG: hypothetical protein JXR37_24755, partial [Kiritimatiellae bacterium]|nr:hypothetical protein [Kiritimatiellia bacterium]
MRTNAYRYCLAALLAASMGACAVAMAGTGEPTRAPESRETPNPLADPLIGMGPVEQEVYRRVYAGEREQRGRELGWMPREELIEKTSFAKWEIDPAEFRRDLERKRRELAAMRERHFARLTGHARDEKLVARADKATRDLKALASFGKHEDWLALWQVGLLNPQRAAAARSVAEFLNAFHDALSGALREELAKPKFPHNPFGMARSASEMYLVAEAFVRAHPDFEKNEPAAFRKLQAMMGLLKDVAFQAWSFPHSANKDMRRKKPMQTATFRYSGGYTVGNF